MFLGIDLGTSGIKILLIDQDQKEIAAHTEKLTLSRPSLGWSEQDPEAWWRASCKALDYLAETHPQALSEVVAIGLSGQQHGAVLLDSKGEVLRPCILWNDSRAETECALFEMRFPQSRYITGNMAMAGFTAPKLLWVARHEPEIFARTSHILLPKAWLRYRMTGEMLEDMSDASGTLWLDTGKRIWSDAALEATGLSLKNMPDLCEGTDKAGKLKAEFAQRWGMKTQPIFAGSAGDNAAGAVGLGATNPGSMFLSLGTSGVLWATQNQFYPQTQSAIHSFCHTLPQRWHQMGVMLSAASALHWWSDICGLDEQTLLAELPDEINSPSPVLFAPYLSGERTPHHDARIRGGFVGLSHDTHRAQLTQAVIEGVGFAFRDALEGLRAASIGTMEADVIGGGSKSRIWVSLLSSILGIHLHRLRHGEHGGAFGAARLARLAYTNEDIETICTSPERLETLEPQQELQASYHMAYQRYRNLYPSLTPFNAEPHPITPHSAPIKIH